MIDKSEICRSSMRSGHFKTFSKNHKWLISHCDENGNAVCVYCQARF